MKFCSFLGTASLLLGTAIVASAQVSSAPSLMNFQGRLANPDGTPVTDGTYSVQFALYDALTGGNQKWTQTVSGVTVHNGTFSVLLSGFPATTFNGNLWLELTVGTNAALSPRQQIVSVAFAMKANTVPDGSIGTAQLADGSVTAAKLAVGSSNATGTAGGDLTGTYPNPLLVSSASLLTKVSGGILTSTGGRIGINNSSPNTSSLLDIRNGSLFLTSAAANVRAVTGYNSTSDAGYFQIYNNVNKIVAGATSGTSNGGQLFVNDATGTNQITLNDNGHVIAKVVEVLGGSDVAEPYHVASFSSVKPTPGMVVVMDSVHVGSMKVAAKAYDPAVGGIISGANGIHAGLTLRQAGTVADGEFPVASIGRVWCLCDADANGAISTGTLLTTSTTPGYAMRVTNTRRANGAVIGKAMSSLKHGKGLVLVLVTLK